MGERVHEYDKITIRDPIRLEQLLFTVAQLGSRQCLNEQLMEELEPRERGVVYLDRVGAYASGVDQALLSHT